MVLQNKIARLWLASKRAEINSLEILFDLSQLISHLKKMIHYLQLERGSSVLFLATDLSSPAEINYRDYRSAFCREREVFNELLQEWLNASESKVLAGGVFVSLAKAMDSLDKPLSSARRDIDGKLISSLQAAQALSTVIRALLNVIVEMAELTQEPKISRLMVALIHILNAKELAGQERALGVYILYSGQSEDEDLTDQRLSLIDMQSYYLNGFSDFASKPIREELEATVDEKAIETSRNRFIDKRYIGMDAAAQWFAESTTRIEAFQRIEECLMQHLLKVCAQKLQAADAMLNQDEKWIEDNIVNSSLAIGEASSATAILMDKLNRQGRDLKRTEETLTETKQALHDQKLIQQAKSKIIKNLKVSEEQAHHQLQQLAMKQGKKLAEIAQQVVDKFK